LCYLLHIWGDTGGGVGLVYDSTLHWPVTRSYLSAYRFSALACSPLTVTIIAQRYLYASRKLHKDIYILLLILHIDI